MKQKGQEKIKLSLEKRDAAREEVEKYSIAKERGDLTKEQKEKLVKKQAEVVEMSRQVGEHAAVDWVRSKYPDAKLLYGGPNAKSQVGDFDQVWEVTKADGQTEMIVIECKGGSSGLGTARVDGQAREQGTAAYFERTKDNMRRYSKDIYEKLDEAPDKVNYVLIKAPIDNTGTIIKLIKVAEFDIKNR